MANLQSHPERWLAEDAASLIQTAKTSSKHFATALTTVDAVTPALTKMTEGYVSESGDIAVFLYVAFDETNKRVLASIVLPNDDSDEDFKPRLTVYDEQARELIAAFLCDFPDALFSVDGGKPLVMFIPDAKLKRFVTLSNMLEAVANKWSKLCVAVPGGNAAKHKALGCKTAAELMP